jgi:UDP-3-O-[3-hydroxymyristoyl] glucosamine N-acyltransferase
MVLTLAQLASACDARAVGDPALAVVGVASLARAGPEHLSFFASRHYRDALSATRAGIVVLAPEDAALRGGGACLLAADPYLAYARAAQVLHPTPAPPPGIHPGAWIEDGARVDGSACVGYGAVIGAGAAIGPRVEIGPGCVIGAGVDIGEDSRLVARVTALPGTRIGRRCLIAPGAVLGADGFGHARGPAGWVKVPQLGGVTIGDDVEIGANTTVDRGALEDTIIEDGARLDNLIQVAHGVRIGAHTAIAACVGISGSTRIGARCLIAGGVGFVGHLQVCDDVVVTGMSMVTRSITRPGVYSGIPAVEGHLWRRNIARFTRIEAVHRRLARLEQQIKGRRDE